MSALRDTAGAGLCLVLAICAAVPSGAQTAPAEAEPETGDRRITLELSAIDQIDQACQVTFVVRNGLHPDIDDAVFQAVLFDTDRLVERLSLLDFGSLPAGRLQVRQFALPALDCARLGAVLINDADNCAGTGLDAKDCMAALDPSSRVQGVEMLK
ncbi:hypothetical protein LV82_01578 [Albidovulum inexpectatum]|uniref:Tat pathway signal sequence domain protein n=1 Tax=Albidovulum inexpectatum TaxID=196587 RepID=A0A2S5JHT0_9RHOB|nr:hypothetical protein [Albidovulum inexpectatum]PPB80845.1 hypothetical protein LV82_01578 [Albidovulum inexpectatum]